MSSLLFPTIPTLTFDVVRYPEWHTEKQMALSAKRSTLAYMLYPTIHFEYQYSVLRDDLAVSQLKAIYGLFMACKGSYDTFLFQDPDFSAFASTNQQQFGVGDGTTKTFQLVAYFQNTGGPGYGEIIQNLNGAPVIYANGTVQSSGYTLGATGIVTFTTAPAAGVVLTWSGSFYYRCAFDEDKLDLAKFMNQWWTIKKLPFTTVKL